MLMLSINVGFITNSSSAIYHFPKQVLEHPEVREFLGAFDLLSGFIGSDVWRRDQCDSFCVTKEQKRELLKELQGSEWGSGPTVNTEDDSVVVVYGDEYSGVAQQIGAMLQRVAEELGLHGEIRSDEYN